MEIKVVHSTFRKPRRSPKFTRGGSLRPKVKKVPVKKKKTARQKRLEKELALKKEWLVPQQSHHLRYVGIRGVYWYWLSRDIRKKEWEKYGVCITCLVPIPVWYENTDCGHILASSFCGEFLRLNPINLTIQHKKCNNPRFSPHAGVANALHIDKRHGAGYMERLYSLRKEPAKNPTANEYKALIENLDSYQQAKQLITPLT